MENNKLEVVGVKFFPKEDGVKHNTDKFETKDGVCVFRRGQVFRMLITFSSSYDPGQHRIMLEFHTGREYRRLETTSDLLRVLEPSVEPWPPNVTDWSARRTVVKDDRSVAISVYSPCWIPVGRWSMEVRTELIRHRGYRSSIHVHNADIYLLFNPWNKDDETFFPETSLLDEYVTGDMAHVWVGEDSGPMVMWDVGQFEDLVLPALELALEQDGVLRRHRRGNPVEVARAISRIVNFAGRSGVLIGKWSPDPRRYADGRLPSYWTGSREILQQFLESGGRPVRYAQCWVFAGLVCTFCRALGLPSRIVTNLASGHDSDQSLTLDIYYDERLEEDHFSETIWNFHVWVDVWMKRADLRQPEYDGWQSIDGTPQERSQGRYQCGPSPVRAVHSGDTQAPYDVPFVFAEVNGDRARWMRTRYGLRLIDVHEKTIGQAILTDDPASRSARVKDITAEYKPPEGSVPERMAIWRAASNPHMAIASRRRRELDNHRFLNDVEFEADAPYGIQFGEVFDVSLIVTNKSDEPRSMECVLLMEVVNHMNRPQTIFKSSGTVHLTLAARESNSRGLAVAAAEYAPHLTENSFLRFRVKAYVHETRQPWISDDKTIEVAVPRLNIEINERLYMGRPSVIQLGFDQPIQYRLTNCRVRIGGSGVRRGSEEVVEDIQAGERFFYRTSVLPVRAGTQKITAKFTSNEIPKSESWVEVQVYGRTSPDRRNLEDHMYGSFDDYLDNFIRD